VSLSGPDKTDMSRQRRPGARSALLLAVLPPLLCLGCSGYRRVDVSSVVSVRQAAPAPSGRGLREMAQTVNVSWQVSIDSSVGTGRAGLRLLRAALDFAGASGRTRLASQALAHFGVSANGTIRNPSAGCVRIDVFRTDGLGRESWLVDSNWAVRKLESGALLAWEGDFTDVLSALKLILPAREAAYL